MFLIHFKRKSLFIKRNALEYISSLFIIPFRSRTRIVINDWNHNSEHVHKLGQHQ